MMFLVGQPVRGQKEARSSNPSHHSSPLFLPCACVLALQGSCRQIPGPGPGQLPDGRCPGGLHRARRVSASHQMAGILSQALLALRRQSPQRPPSQPPHQLLQRLWKRRWSIADSRPPESGNGAIAIVNPTPPPSSTPGCATLSPSKLRQFTALLLGRASHPNVVSLLIVDGLVDEGGRGDRSVITKRKRRPEQDPGHSHATRRRPSFGPVLCFVRRVPCSRLPSLIASDPRRRWKTRLEAIRAPGGHCRPLGSPFGLVWVGNSQIRTRREGQLQLDDWSVHQVFNSDTPFDSILAARQHIQLKRHDVATYKQERHRFELSKPNHLLLDEALIRAD